LVFHIPQDLPQPLGKHAPGKRKRSVTRGKSESRGPDDKALLGGGAGAGVGVGEVCNPEEGWDDDTGVVLDYITKEEVSRPIAYTAKMVQPKPAENNDRFFQKVFGDGEFIAAGQLVIPPKGRKPSKGTKDNTYMFYIIEGAVNRKVHDTTLVLASGAMFLVPRGKPSPHCILPPTIAFPFQTDTRSRYRNKKHRRQRRQTLLHPSA